MSRKLKVIAAAALSLSCATVAVAADLPARYVAPVAPEAPKPAFTFDGFYAGVIGGYGMGVGNGQGWKPSSLFGKRKKGGHAGVRQSERKDGRGGFVGGAQLGYNVQQGQFVFGIETDLNYAGLPLASKRVTSSAAETSRNARVNWFGTLRPRIGFVPTERLMIYGTGGLAYGSVTSARDAAMAGASVGERRSDVRVGYTLGAGVEYAIADNVTLRGSYDFVDLGRGGRGRKSTVAPAADTVAAGARDRARFQVFRVGLNYRF